jgi:hypothetical protein
MNAFGTEGFGALREVEVEVHTSAYRITGTVRTPFGRVAEILNQLPSTHLAVERATLSEHAGDASVLAAPNALIALDEIVLLIAGELSGEPRAEMRIQKRPVRAQLELPPFRITGQIHVPIGSRPIDGLLNVVDRFVPMTDVTVISSSHPHLERTVPALALRRDRAHVLLIADDERPDQLLADVLDERTAEAWLRSGERSE